MDRNQKYPVWADVGVPPVLVEHLRSLPPGRTLNAVVAGVVRHAATRVSINYHCETCGHQHKPQRSADEYSICTECQSMAIRCVRSLKPSSDRAAGQPARPARRQDGGGYALRPPQDPPEDEDATLTAILSAMCENYSKYFGVSDPGEFVHSTWRGGQWRVRFVGGEDVSDPSVAAAHKKASVLCPFLWDRNYDWKKGFRIQEAGRRVHLTPILWHLAMNAHG